MVDFIGSKTINRKQQKNSYLCWRLNPGPFSSESYALPSCLLLLSFCHPICFHIFLLQRSFFDEDEAEQLLMTRIPMMLSLLDQQVSLFIERADWGLTIAPSCLMLGKRVSDAGLGSCMMLGGGRCMMLGWVRLV